MKGDNRISCSNLTRKFKLILAIGVIVFTHASNPLAQGAMLSKSEPQNIVILGEGGKSPATARYYADKYNAQVFYKEEKASCGFLCEAVSASIRNTFRKSGSIQHLANELKSINNKEGEWTLIIPSFAERYFLLVLHNMEDGTLSNAKVTVRLIDSSKNKAIETEDHRISKGKVAVNYG